MCCGKGGAGRAGKGGEDAEEEAARAVPAGEAEGGDVRQPHHHQQRQRGVQEVPRDQGRRVRVAITDIDLTYRDFSFSLPISEFLNFNSSYA